MHKHSRCKKVGIYFPIIVFVIFIITVTVAMFFKHRPMIRSMNYPHIHFIEIMIKEDGEISRFYITKNEISDELADNLISVFLNTDIRRSLFPLPQTYEILDGTTYITVGIGLENAETLAMYVNLCSSSQYNSAQFGDTHYYIVDYQKVYNDIYCLLSDRVF